MKYIQNSYVITAFEVNNVLSSQKIVISQETLETILSLPRLIFNDLSEDTISSETFKNTIGTIRKESSTAGVYIWTHKETGQKYVGSSSRLARRLIGYIRGTHKDTGKLIPLLRKDGVGAFTLEVILLNENYSGSLEHSIEQYFLLQKGFTLNTLRVVNKISGSRSKPIYMYTKDLSKLIFSSTIQEDFIFKLGIHHSIINSDAVYLDRYVFTDQPIEGVGSSNLSLAEVFTQLEKDRLTVIGRSIQLISETNPNEKKSFNSIKDCLNYLNSIGKANKTTLYSRIRSGKPYYGYICKYNEEQIRVAVTVRVRVTNLLTNTSAIYPTMRKAALSFSPDIITTGQTMKAYAKSGKIFKDIYKIDIIE